MTTEQMEDMICMALGGRAAEQIMLGRITTGMVSSSCIITICRYHGIFVEGMFSSGKAYHKFEKLTYTTD